MKTRYRKPEEEFAPVRQMPSAPEAERAIVACVIDKGADALAELFPPLAAHHFYRRSHQIIIEQALAMDAKGEGIDITTMTDALRQAKRLEEVGGVYGITELWAHNCGVTLAQEYSKRILTCYRTRGLIEAGTLLISGAHERPDEPEAMLAEAERKLSIIAEDGIEQPNLTARALASLETRIEDRLAGRALAGLPTGIEFFDKRFGGLVEGREIAICARPGYGKTSLVEQMVEKLLDDEVPCLVFEADMSAEAFLTRMACRASGISYGRFERGTPHRETYEKVRAKAREMAVEKKLILMSPPTFTGEFLRATVRRYKRSHGIGAVLVDHFQLMGQGATDKEMRVSLVRAAQGIKASVQDSGLPHVVIAQLNRDADRGSRPRASHIAECDRLFADADGVCLLWSKDSQNRAGGIGGDGEENLVEVVCTVDKNRFGPCGDVDLLFDTKLSKFVSKAREDFLP